MADTFLLEVATPERLYLRERAEEAQIPAADGYLGILPGHAALLSELGQGELSYSAEGRRHSLKIEGGWLEVADDRVRVLATTAQAQAEE
jgi:F-type H+-transporting ATPase subunit epsilon